MKTDFSDLRFVNTSCNNGGSELSHFLRSKVDSSWATYDVLLDGTQTVISIYYGNPSASSTSSISNVWGANTLLYVTLDEGSGTNLRDLAGNDNNGTLTAGTGSWTSSCKKGNCFDFDGTASKIAFSNIASQNAFTAMFWYQKTDTADGKAIFAFDNYPSTRNFVDIFSI
jgi:hypothetical protein